MLLQKKKRKYTQSLFEEEKTKKTKRKPLKIWRFS